MNNLLQKNGFYGTVEFSDDCDCFRGRILGINDLITFEGQTVAEVKQSFYAAVENYTELCKATGKATKKSYNGHLYLRINPELHKKAEISASASNISLSRYIESAIERSMM